MDPLLGWKLDVVPDFSFNFSRDPFWSPEIYEAVVWDNNVALNISAKANIMIEFAKMTYFTFEVNMTALKWSFGIQQFLSEEDHPHLCTMLYTESKMGTVALSIETNTKPCSIKPFNMESLSLHFGANMDKSNKMPWDKEVEDILTDHPMLEESVNVEPLTGFHNNRKRDDADE